MEIKDINVIVPTKSYNLGTQKGCQILKRSIKELGCCRSIVVDRNNKVLIGNKTLDAAKLSGITKVAIMETAGDELVVVKRNDIDFDTKKGQDICILDNITQEANLQYDTDYIIEQMNNVWGFDPKDWYESFCLQKKMEIDDFFSEFESQKHEGVVEESKVEYRQLTLFDEDEE